jgi:hypothetical protein
MPGLTEHRPDPAHLEHEPLQHLVPGAWLAREEPAGLLAEVDEDRARLEDRDRLSVGAVGIDDGGMRLLGLIFRNPGVNCSPLPMFTGTMRYGTSVSSKKIVIFHPFGVGQ